MLIDLLSISLGSQSMDRDHGRSSHRENQGSREASAKEVAVEPGRLGNVGKVVCSAGGTVMSHHLTRLFSHS
jgi:hypothetical protein